MSENRICTFEQLSAFVRSSVSEKRYLHSIGVAQSAQMLLEYYGCRNYEKTWKGFCAPAFCGIIHDLAREKTEKELLEYCRVNAIETSSEERAFPVLVHGKVSAHMAMTLCPGYPQSWKKAVEVHTTGGPDMDDLAIALFTADFIEPSRVFLSDSKRRKYLEQPTLYGCAYAVLCDMIAHWLEKGYHEASEGSVALKQDLERRLGI